MGRLAEAYIKSKETESYKKREININGKNYITSSKESIERAFEKPFNEIKSRKIF